MRIFRFFGVSVASCVLLASAAAQAITLEAHVKKLVTETCTIIMSDACKKTLSEEDKKTMPADQAECVALLSSPYEGENKAKNISDDWSNKCVASIKAVKPADCQKAVELMEQGACDLKRAK